MFFGVLLTEAIGLRAPGNQGLVLPLLATQILWINLVTDGAPALALGVDPVDAGTMAEPPRPRGERVITRRMWVRIFLVGAVMAAGTLLVLDGSLPGGFIEGSGDLRHAQTMAFMTLTLFQLFNVLNARSDRGARWALLQLLAVGSDRGIGRPASRCDLRAVYAAGLLDRGPRRHRLVGLHGGGKLGAVAVRTSQAGWPTLLSSSQQRQPRAVGRSIGQQRRAHGQSEAREALTWCRRSGSRAQRDPHCRSCRLLT